MATVFLKKDTLRILCEPGELQLPERLEQDDGRRIGEVERPQPRVFAHGDADRLLLMRCDKVPGKACRLLAEQQHIFVLVADVGIQLFALRRGQPHAVTLLFL